MKAGLYCALTVATIYAGSSLSHASAIDQDLCGEAAWFEAGGLTASGEQSQSDSLTAAHPSLPFGTQVEIDNLANDRSTVVRINDRASFKRGRVILVSRAAAEELGMLHDGTANVRLTVLREGSSSSGQCRGANEVVADRPPDAAPTFGQETAIAVPQEEGSASTDPLEETAISEEMAASRFEVAFQPQSWQEAELAKAIAAFAPRRRIDRQEKRVSPTIPWPSLDGLEPLRLSSAFIAYAMSDDLSLPHLARFERRPEPAHLSQLMQ